jgi:hypothetical protein
MIEIKCVACKDASLESARAGLRQGGLGELDTGGLVSVYRVDGYIYKFYGIVNLEWVAFANRHYFPLASSLGGRGVHDH